MKLSKDELRILAALCSLVQEGWVLKDALEQHGLEDDGNAITALDRKLSATLAQVLQAEMRIE